VEPWSPVSAGSSIDFMDQDLCNEILQGFLLADGMLPEFGGGNSNVTSTVPRGPRAKDQGTQVRGALWTRTPR